MPRCCLKWLFPVLVLLSCLFSPTAFEPPGHCSQQATSTALQERPDIEILEATFDFGDNVEGNEVVHDFRVKNVGREVLEIKKVTPG